MTSSAEFTELLIVENHSKTSVLLIVSFSKVAFNISKVCLGFFPFYAKIATGVTHICSQ
jgi:hypothetical protein